jgi:TatD DNase family protein
MNTKPECVKAIGEFGLDFFRMISSKDEQEKAMHFFMNYAKDSGLPLFLHEREAFSAFHSILKEHHIPNKVWFIVLLVINMKFVLILI